MSAGESPSLGYAAAAGQLYLAFTGSATHQASRVAERLLADFLAGQPPQPTVILDMEACGWVDSTFAGWMVKLWQQLGPAAGRVVVARCPAACRSSLHVMGLTSMFEFRDVSRPPSLQHVPCPEIADDAETVEFMLDAHQRLAELSPENRRAFARIAEELSREFKRRTH